MGIVRSDSERLENEITRNHRDFHKDEETFWNEMGEEGLAWTRKTAEGKKEYYGMYLSDIEQKDK